MKFSKRMFGLTVGAALALTSGVVFAQAGETIKIAHIDPFSGPFANVAQNQSPKK